MGAQREEAMTLVADWALAHHDEIAAELST